MLNCPHCGVLLGEQFSLPAPCPACKAMLTEVPVAPGKSTVADCAKSSNSNNATIELPPSEPPPNKPATVYGNIAATIDSWSPAAEPSPPASHAQTVDSGSGFDLVLPPSSPNTDFSLASPGGRNPSLTAVDRRVAQTLDSHEIEADVKKVTGIWSKTYTPESKPWQTLKGEDKFNPKDTKLVIKSRALRTATPEKSTGAEYELLGVIGEGGMGVVYSARQASIDRQVAIKMLKPEAASDGERREKFLSEAVVTGELDHPNIVPIYDLGANEQNALFYSMKRVHGTPWSAVIAQKTQSENIDILLKVADAVGFAHARGVVHRDLKPENVMLGDFGEVLVMDWGLALSTPTFRKPESITQTSSMGGTPAYMAPEMAMGPIGRVGPPADVYLLGAILYEIIAGKPPHAGASVMTCLHAAARNQIQPTEASGELLDIALHAMSAEPEDRYPAVRDFQQAVRLYQDHSESIALSVRAEQDLAEATEKDDYQQFARALFAFEEAQSLWNGNERAGAGGRLARLAYARSADRKGDYDLAASLLTGDDAEQNELRQKVVAAASERDARQQRLRNAKRLLVALAALVVIVVTGAYFQVRTDRDRAVMAQREATEQRDVAKKSQAEAELARADEAKQKQVAQAATLVADQKRKDEASARRDAEVAQKVAVDAKQAEEYEAYIARIGLAAAKIEENSFGYAEQLLAECPDKYRNWEWGRLKYLCQQGVRKYHCEGPIDAVAFAPDGRRFVTGSADSTVRIWDTQSGELVRAIPYGALYVHGVAWSPDGQLVAAAGNDARGAVKVWNAKTGKLIQTFVGHGKQAALSVAFSRDNKRLLTTSYDNTARISTIDSGKEWQKFEGHSWWVWSAAFSPDEKRIVTASQDGTVRIWDVKPDASAKVVQVSQVSASAEKASSEPAVFVGHRGPVYSACFSHDGTRVVSGGYDNRVLVWNPDEIKPFDFRDIFSNQVKHAAPVSKELDGHSAAVRNVQFSPDNRMIASAGHDNTVRLWDAVSGKLIKVLRGHAGWVRSCAFSLDTKFVLSGSHDYEARLWSIAGYEEMRVLSSRLLEGHDDAVLAAAFSRDGARVATASRDRTAKTWDVATGKQLQTFREGHEFLASSAVFSGDGNRLVTAAIDNTTRIWDVETGTQKFVLEGTGRSAALALSPDGATVITGSEPDQASAKLERAASLKHRAQLWNVNDGKLLHTIDDLRSEVTALAFTTGGDLFCIGDVTGRVQLRNTESREQVWVAERHSGPINSAAFTPDGKRLLTASTDKTVAQWDVASGKELQPLVLKHPDAVTSLAVDPKGKFVVTSCADNQIRVWSIEDGKPLGEFATPDAQINSVALSPDGRRAVAVGELRIKQQNLKTEERRPLVRVWDLASGKPVDDLKVRGTQVWAGVFSPDGGAVLTVGGNDARLWDLATGVQRMSFSPHGAVASVCFSPDGRRLATASWDNSARIWNADTGKSERKLKEAHAGGVNSAVFSPDGAYVLTCSDDKTVRLWNAGSGELLNTYQGHAGRVRSANFSADGELAITGSNDKTARIWKVESGDVVQTFKGHEWAVTSAVLSADATRVLTGSEDKSAKIWNAQTGQCLLTLSGHTAPVTSVALSPDGARALTASQDNICKLWDAKSGKEILTLKGHTQELTSVSFSDDGRHALTASRDGTAIIWLTAPWGLK